MTSSRTSHPAAVLSVAAFVASIVAANYLTARYGLVPVLPGLLVTAGTYAAGVALFARDVVQDAGGRTLALAAIAAGVAVSWVMSTPALALASGAAFALSEVADLLIYTPLRRRGWARAVVASNIVGAVVDTLVFLALAGFPITVAMVGGQLVGKVVWATLPFVAVGAALRARRSRRLDSTALA